MQFLSAEWIDAMDAAARTIPPDAVEGVTMTVEHCVGGDRWRLVIADGTVRVAPTSADGSEPDVRFSSPRTTAAAIANGEKSALEAFMVGDLKVGGDLSVLLAHQKTLAAIDDVFADVRAATTYPS